MATGLKLYTGSAYWEGYSSNIPGYISTLTYYLSGQTSIAGSNSLSEGSPGVNNYWTGYFYAPSTGVYNFYVTTTKSALLWVGSNALSAYSSSSNSLISNIVDSSNVTQSTSASVTLEAGYHPFSVLYGYLPYPQQYSFYYLVEASGPTFSRTSNLSAYLVDADPSVTPTPTPTVTPTVTPTPTPTISVTPTVTPTISVTPSITPTISVTPTLSITPTPTPTPGLIAAYTPWTAATTNSPIWVQAVSPQSGPFTKYKVTWGQTGSTLLTASYNANATTDNYFLYSYTTPATGYSSYTLTVEGTEGAGSAPRTLLNRFYVKTSTPTIDLNTFYDPVVSTPALPYELKDVLVGSNEWAVDDVINASLDKLIENFSYLKSVAAIYEQSDTLSLVEWANNFVNPASSNWQTQIPGLADGNFFEYVSTSATGVAYGTIKDIKSYRYSNTTAPDYITYIAFTSAAGYPTHVELRYNNYQNELALSANSLGTSTQTFNNILSIDVLGTSLYVLDNNNTVYRLAVDVVNNNFTPVNQVGGPVSGLQLDKNYFNGASEVRTYDESVYVADSNNSCVKVYNTALTWTNVITDVSLSAYNVQTLEINRTNGDLFVLGKLFAPVAPIVTSFTSTVTAIGDTNSNGILSGAYKLSWVHDGLRLRDSANTNLNNYFVIYGLASGSGEYLPLSVPALSAQATVFPTSVGNTLNFALTGAVYSDFKVQALGNNGYNSELSNNTPIPSNYYFNTPYKVYQFSNSGTLLNTFPVPNGYTKIQPEGNIASTDNINKMVIDPTGAFLYFVTDHYLYKYITTGQPLFRINDPSRGSLGNRENITAGFIDDRLNFFLATEKRVFKYADIPLFIDLYDTANVDRYFITNDHVKINSNEFIQDWVYNKAFLRLQSNLEILYKAINSKLVVKLDSDGNLLQTSNNFANAALSASNISSIVDIDNNCFIHSNEFVTADVVNRTLTCLYNLELGILNRLTPAIFKMLPDPSVNSITVNPTPTPSGS